MRCPGLCQESRGKKIMLPYRKGVGKATSKGKPFRPRRTFNMLSQQVWWRGIVLKCTTWRGGTRDEKDF